MHWQMRSVECSEFSVQRGLANSSTFAHGPTHAIPVPDSGRQARAATVPLSQVVPTTCCTPTTICLQHVVRMDSLSCGAGPCQSALRQSLQSRALFDAIGSLGRSNAYSCRFETTRTASHLRHPPRLRLRRSQTIHLHIRPLRPINMQGKKVATRKVARRGVGKWWRPLAPASRSHRGLGIDGKRARRTDRTVQDHAFMQNRRCGWAALPDSIRRSSRSHRGQGPEPRQTPSTWT